MLTLPQTIEQDGTEDRRELDRLLAGVAAGDRDALARLYELFVVKDLEQLEQKYSGGWG